MGPGAGAAESEVPLQELRVYSNGHLKTVREPEPPRNYRKCYYKNCRIVLTVALAVVFLSLIIAVIVLAVLAPKRPSADLCPPACPDGWIGYQGKCYYFSETEGNWTYSQSQCSALSASLAVIDSEQDMAQFFCNEVDFAVNYNRSKIGPLDWTFYRELLSGTCPDQHWKGD